MELERERNRKSEVGDVLLSLLVFCSSLSGGEINEP